MSLYKLIRGTVVNPKSDKSCQLFEDGLIVAKKNSKGDYKIEAVGSYKTLAPKYSDKRSVEQIDFTNKLLIPSFFDMHFHWVQDDVRLMPKDSLLEWLSKYTWPYEAKFKDKKYSLSRAQKFSKELARTGTLGGACYASIHGHSVEHAHKSFIGDFTIGNVLMTMNSPDYLMQTKANALSLVKKLSSKFKKAYAMTPRFAPTTHPEVMKEAAKIARQNKSFIQTHLSETENECDYVMSMYKEIKGFEKVKSYTEIYKKCNILGKNTIMGHGIYLSKDELSLLKKSGTSIAHCPTSNAPIKDGGLGSGLFDFKLVEKNKVHWALASDIGGGPFLSMIDVMNSFVAQNRKKKVEGATYKKALYRATLAGAEMMNLEKSCGNLQSGKYLKE